MPATPDSVVPEQVPAHDDASKEPPSSTGCPFGFKAAAGEAPCEKSRRQELKAIKDDELAERPHMGTNNEPKDALVQLDRRCPEVKFSSSADGRACWAADGYWCSEWRRPGQPGS